MDLLREFASKSGIRGFSYAETSNKYIRFMWYCIICACVITTIYDVSETVKYYMSYPTTTKVELTNNETLYFGSPTLCIPYQNHMNLNEYHNASKQEIFQLLECVKAIYTEPSTKLDYLNQSNVEISISLIIATLSSLTRAQHYVTDSNHPYDYDWGYAEVSKPADYIILLNEGSNQVQSTYEWLQANNISAESALNTSVRLLYRMFNVVIQISTLPPNNTSLFEPTWLGMQTESADWYEEVFCFKLPEDNFRFKSSVAWAEIQFLHPHNYTPTDTTHAHMTTLDFSQDPSPLAGGFNQIWQTIARREVVKVSVAARYKQISKVNKPCSHVGFPSKCRLYCRLNHIERWCNCTPLYQLPKNTLKECEIQHFQTENPNCSLAKTSSNPDRQCKSGCHEKCERLMLSFSQNSQTLTNSNATAMRIYADPYSFPEFEEVPLLSSRQILGSIGGNLSLYIGANFMLLYYAVFYWLSAVLLKLKAKFEDSVLK